MKLPVVSVLVVCVAVVAFSAGSAFTEEKPKPKPLTPAQMEAKVFTLNGKCPEHDLLKPLIGVWDLKGIAKTHQMGDIPFGGTVKYVSKWDGRFLHTYYEGPGMGPGQKMLGEGFIGFNRLSNKFEGTWMMSTNTNISVVSGTFDKASKTFKYTGSMGMPDGTTWKVRQEFQLVSADEMTEKQWVTPPGGDESMTVTMTYTRKAAAPTTGAK